MGGGGDEQTNKTEIGGLLAKVYSTLHVPSPFSRSSFSSILSARAIASADLTGSALVSEFARSLIIASISSTFRGWQRGGRGGLGVMHARGHSSTHARDCAASTRRVCGRRTKRRISTAFYLFVRDNTQCSKLTLPRNEASSGSFAILSSFSSSAADGSIMIDSWQLRLVQHGNKRRICC